MFDGIKGIAVDLAGVYVGDGFPETVSKYAISYGIEHESLEKTKDVYWKPYSLGQISTKYFWYNVFKEHGIELSNEEIIKINTDVIESHYPRPEVINPLKILHKSYKTCLFTNTAKPWLKESFKRINTAIKNNEPTGWYAKVEDLTEEEE